MPYISSKSNLIFVCSLYIFFRKTWQDPPSLESEIQAHTERKKKKEGPHPGHLHPVQGFEIQGIGEKIGRPCISIAAISRFTAAEQRCKEYLHLFRWRRRQHEEGCRYE